MHHTTFEKNWPCRFKEEFKNVQLLTHDDGRIPITMDHITRGKNRRTGVFLHAWLSKNRDMEICLARPY